MGGGYNSTPTQQPVINQQPQSVEKPKRDGYGFSLAGFICSFIMPILGIIFSALGLGRIKEAQSQRGKNFAIAGLIISIVVPIVVVIINMAATQALRY